MWMIMRRQELTLEKITQNINHEEEIMSAITKHAVFMWK